jgi:hypothetical protein
MVRRPGSALPRSRPAFGPFFSLVVVLASAGCGGSFGAGVRDYDHGRYPEALEELRSVECDAATWSSASRARYALYRGLTLLALGARPAAVHWLGEAKRALDEEPMLLSDGDAGRLASAWAHLPLDDAAKSPAGQ